MLSFYLTLVDGEEDKNKLERLYELYRLKMWYTANRILSDGFLAEDAVHDAFIGVAKNIGKIGDAESSKTCAYLITAARNSAISMMRKSRNDSTVNLDELFDFHDSKADSDFEEMETQKRARHILEQMPETYRDVLYYFLVEEMSEKEIASLLSRNINTVRQQVRRGKVIFAEKFKKGEASDGKL